MAEICIRNKDFVTFQFIQWFLEEQIQEEMSQGVSFELFDVIGEEGTSRWKIGRAGAKGKIRIVKPFFRQIPPDYENSYSIIFSPFMDLPDTAWP